jgi:hypothetical protein
MLDSIEQNILRTLVARVPKSCLIAKILPDCQILARLLNACIHSYVYFAKLPKSCQIAKILPGGLICLKKQKLVYP